MTALAEPRAARVLRLRLFQFRNYQETVVEFSPGLNLITGENAQGKTNLLEAVATLALTRSPRAATAEELLRWGCSQSRVEAALQRPGGSSAVALRFERSRETGLVVRTATVDGKPRRPRDVLGLCPVVLFAPEDLHLVNAGPERRRRQLDMLLAQLDPRASLDLIQFRRVLMQRNALLRQLRGGGHSGALAGFTEALADHGGRVRVARAALLAAMLPTAAAAVQEISGGRDLLGLDYLADGEIVEPRAAASDTSHALRETLQRRAGEERLRGMTLAGPHRDDVDIRLGGRYARSGASQGQQRSIVLALKLAEVEVVGSTAGLSPVLLLDDVLGELDLMRRDYLLAALVALGRIQLLVTSTEASPFPIADFPESRRFAVSSGTVGDAKMA